MGDLTISRFGSNEIAKQDDFNYGEQQGIENLNTLFEMVFNATNDVVIHGLTVQERGTPSMNVDITAGIAFCQSTGKTAHVGSIFGPVSIANGSGSDRIDVIEIRITTTDFDEEQRAFRNPSSGNITYQDWDTKTRYEIEAQVIQGTPGSGVAPSHTSGWIKLAEILVSAGESTAMYDADIDNITGGYDGEVTTNWTSETSITFKLGNIEYMKSLFRIAHDEDGDHKDDSIKDNHIDWGTSAGKVSAVDLPIADAGSLITSTEVENALQELAQKSLNILTVTTSADYSAASLIKDHRLFVNPTSGSITLGLFNGSSRDGSKVEVCVIGTANQVDVELVSNGTTDVVLYPGQVMKVVWDNTNSEWVIHNPFAYFVSTITASHDFSANELINDRKLFVNTTSGNVTLGLFNGANRDGTIMIIQAVGSGSYLVNIELVSNGTTDRALSIGDSIIIVWDDTSSEWKILSDQLFFEEKTSSFTMISNKKYFANGVINMTLPVVANTGETIEIVTSDYSRIIQNNADHVISYMNKYFTTKGTSGYLQFFGKSKIKLMYKGNGDNRIEPGVKLSNPGTLPTGEGNGCCFSLDGVYLAVVHDTSPYITIYKRSGDTFTKLSDPGTLPTGEAEGCAFSPCGTYLAVVHHTSPYLTIYERSGDTFTKLSNPATLPGITAYGCDFSSDGNYLAVTHQSGFIVYKISGSTFTESDSFTLGQYTFYCRFSPDNTYLTVATSGTPYIYIYRRIGDTFVKLSNPSTLPPSAAFEHNFTPDGKYLIIATGGSSYYLTIYEITGDTFTKIEDPEDMPPSTSEGLAVSRDGKYIAVGHNLGVYMTVYKKIGGVFIKLSDPASTLSDKGYGCDFSPDGRYLAIVTHGSPYINIYKNVESTTKVWEVLSLDSLNNPEIMFK